MISIQKEKSISGLVEDYYKLKDHKLMSKRSLCDRVVFADVIYNEMMRNDIYMYRRNPETQPPVLPFSDSSSHSTSKMINLASNDYLWYRHRHALIYESVRATEMYGTGSGSVPMFAGTTKLHRQLEDRLASFTGFQSAITYNSGYAANTGVLTALLGSSDMAILDMHVHASIIDGCVNTNKTFFIHNDIDSLRCALKKTESYKNRVVVVDGVYSMDGDIADLPSISRVAREEGAWVMVDDSHALGVIGMNGRGTQSYFETNNLADIVTGSLGKAMGGAGGFVAGSRQLIHLLELTSRTFVFSTSIAPAAVAAILKSIDLLEAGDKTLKLLQNNIAFFHKSLKPYISSSHKGNTGVIPLIITDPFVLLDACRKLYDEGIMVSPVFYPVVPKKKSRLRISVNAGLSEEQSAFATEKIISAIQPVIEIQE